MARGELSAREQEVVRLIAKGYSEGEIVDKLQITKHTVRTHVEKARIKARAKNRAMLVAYYVQHYGPVS